MLCNKQLMKRYCFALDLVDNALLIEEYENWHRNSWPEIKKSITESGITHMEIYRTGSRLFMIMDTDSTFSLQRKVEMDASNQRVQEWEELMSKFQKPLPWAKEGEKWILMNKIYEL